MSIVCTAHLGSIQRNDLQKRPEVRLVGAHGSQHCVGGGLLFQRLAYFQVALLHFTKQAGVIQRYAQTGGNGFDQSGIVLVKGKLFVYILQRDNTGLLSSNGERH